MQTMEQRVREHAVAAGLLAADQPMNSYAAEGAAWCADACASALEAGADLRDVSRDICTNMRLAGASGAEQVFAQLVVVEIEALVQRLACDEEIDVAAAVRKGFRWTEGPHAGGGIGQVLKLVHARDLSRFDRHQAKQIYATALNAFFGSRAKAFRAWAIWAADPECREASPWRRHHARAEQLAFAGLDVNPSAGVTVRFTLQP